MRAFSNIITRPERLVVQGGDFLRQHFTDIALNRNRINGYSFFAFLGNMRFNFLFFFFWAQPVEFFFEGLVL